MAMKVKSNKAKGYSGSDKYISGTDTSTKPSYSVREISNGYVMTKSWCDEKGKYHSIEKYHESNPLEEESEKEE